MSLAAEILREAVERGRRVADEHLRRVSDVAGEMSRYVGRPWEHKLEQIRGRQEPTGGESSDT